MKKLLSTCCLLAGLLTAGLAQTAHDGSADPIEKAKGLQKQLMLSDKQTSKVTEIYKESSRKFGVIKTKDQGNTNKMMVDVGPLRKETIKKIEDVLTPFQRVKYERLIKDSKKSSINGGWSDGWSSTE